LGGKENERDPVGVQRPVSWVPKPTRCPRDSRRLFSETLEGGRRKKAARHRRGQCGKGKAKHSGDIQAIERKRLIAKE